MGPTPVSLGLTADASNANWKWPLVIALVPVAGMLVAATMNNATAIHIKNKDGKLSYRSSSTTNGWRTAFLIFAALTVALVGVAIWQHGRLLGALHLPDSPVEPSVTLAPSAVTAESQVTVPARWPSAGPVTAQVVSDTSPPSVDEARLLITNFLLAGGAGRYDDAWAMLGSEEQASSQWKAGGQTVKAPAAFVAYWTNIRQVGPSTLVLADIAPQSAASRRVQTVLIWTRKNGDVTHERTNFTVSRSGAALTIDEWTFVCMQGGQSCP